MSNLNVRKDLPKGSKRKNKKKKEETLTDWSEIFTDYEKDDVLEDDYEDNKPKKFQDTSLGRILNAIQVTKNSSLLEEYSSIEKDFNYYIVCRFLSMIPEYCELLEMVDEYQNVLSKNELFKLLVEIIPKGKTYEKYIKPDKEIDDDRVRAVSRYFEVSIREARNYCRMMGSEWSQDIKKKFGGLEK